MSSNMNDVFEILRDMPLSYYHSDEVSKMIMSFFSFNVRSRYTTDYA